MASGGILLEKSKYAIKWVEETKQRLTSPNLLSNPWDGSVKNIEGQDYMILLFSLEPRFPNTIWIFFITLLGAGLWKGFTLSLWYLVPLFFLSTQFFYSKYYIYLMLSLALRRHAYGGKFHFLTNREIIRGEVLGWDKMR